MKIKHLYVFIAFMLCVISHVNAQLENDLLDENNLHIPINTSALIGVMGEDFGYAVAPADSLSAIMESAALWMSGKDQDGIIRGFHPRYPDYLEISPGPYFDATLSVLDSINLISKYHKIWKLSSEQIAYHKIHYADVGYSIPEAIETWPANGDTTIGMAELLAPFYDNNENKLYEPMLGDYPLIKGDLMLFTIANNYTTTIDDFQQDKTGIEIHCMMYAYQGEKNTALGNTVFVNYQIYNRSQLYDFDSLYFGMFCHGAIGNYEDDYSGSDSALNLFYFYNSDDDDEGINGFNNKVPTFGINFLSHPMKNFLIFNNDISPMDEPENAEETFNYLQGIWQDGVHLSYGGNGYGADSSINFMYPSYPSADEGWSELSEFNTPYYRRGIGGSGPVQLFRNENVCLEFAFIFAQENMPYDNLASLDLLKEYTTEIQTLYPTLEAEECLNYTTEIEEENNFYQQNMIEYFPNPAHDKLFLKFSISDTEQGYFQILNASGELIYVADFSHTQKRNEIIEINISQFSAGLYIAKIFTEAAVSSAKFMIE